MVGRRRRRRRRLLLLLSVAGIVVAVLVVGAVKVLAEDDPDDPCQAPQAAPAAQAALMPDGLSFDRIGTVTRVTKDESNVNVEAISTKPLDELTVLIQDAVTAAGYRPAGMDNEGDEAEVFFTTGPLAAGQARVREAADCDGRWDIDLVLLERGAEP
jgi:hypothetical protein